MAWWESRRDTLATELAAIRKFTCELYAHLSASERAYPQRSDLNLPLWELGHIAWFQEWWCSRFPNAYARPSLLANADQLFDSSNVSHASRWHLPLLDQAHTRDFLSDTLARTLAVLRNANQAQLYFFELALRHEAMHIEAGMMSLQALGLPAPHDSATRLPPLTHAARDVTFCGSTVTIGRRASDISQFVFDNEKWAHDVLLRPFSMSSRLVTNGEFAAFVASHPQAQPAHWRRCGAQDFEVRTYATWAAMDERAAVCNLDATHAEAYCAWAGRRLPTEHEWEHAIATQPDAFPDAFGHVWQWTASTFAPYPGFAADPYQDYSQPWFDAQHRSLRGSSFVTHASLSNAHFRNFYLANRRVVFAGLRTCALEI